MPKSLPIEKCRILVASKFTNSRKNTLLYLKKIGASSQKIDVAENALVVNYRIEQAHTKYNLIIIDYFLPHLNLDSFLESINKSTAVLFCYTQHETIFKDFTLSNFNISFLLKPIRLDNLKLAINKIMDINI